ncbi:MAG: hypothetical protein K2Q34_05165 [Alphaproteobacteria bacterium]|nr:hypothetical protein [Alphaproteobacteria bacterium]
MFFITFRVIILSSCLVFSGLAEDSPLMIPGSKKGPPPPLKPSPIDAIGDPVSPVFSVATPVGVVIDTSKLTTESYKDPTIMASLNTHTAPSSGCGLPRTKQKRERDDGPPTVIPSSDMQTLSTISAPPFGSPTSTHKEGGKLKKSHTCLLPGLEGLALFTTPTTASTPTTTSMGDSPGDLSESAVFKEEEGGDG